MGGAAYCKVEDQLVTAQEPGSVAPSASSQSATLDSVSMVEDARCREDDPFAIVLARITAEIDVPIPSAHQASV